MIILFVVLVIITSVVISLFILVQNPKGGGLSGSIAGFNSQFMGVKQTTDILEKGTWIMATAIGLLCLFSTVFIPSGSTSVQERNPGAARPATEQTTPLVPPPATPQQTPGQ